MKKNKLELKKLSFTKTPIQSLTEVEKGSIKAGDDVNAAAPRDTYFCPPPYNAPPYFYPNTKNECVVG